MKQIIATMVLVLPVQIALADHHKVKNAVVADPKHYSVEFENDVLRVVRINYGPGESSVMNSHEANCSIMISGGDFKMELPDGSIAEAPLSEVGDVNCGDAEAHLPMNVGETGSEVILVELKGRETF
jgi:hypothetical protein